MSDTDRPGPSNTPFTGSDTRRTSHRHICSLHDIWFDIFDNCHLNYNTVYILPHDNRCPKEGPGQTTTSKHNPYHYSTNDHPDIDRAFDD